MIFVSAITQNAVRMSLANDDEMELQAGTGLALHDAMPPSILIHTGMELEELQYVLCLFLFPRSCLTVHSW
jgi:hypothetical protein